MADRFTGFVLLGIVTAVGCSAPDSQPTAPVLAEPTAVEDRGDPTAIRPFEITVPDAVLEDLDRRLAQTRFPDQIGDSWEYGTDVTYLRELITYYAMSTTDASRNSN